MHTTRRSVVLWNLIACAANANAARAGETCVLSLFVHVQKEPAIIQRAATLSVSLLYQYGGQSLMYMNCGAL